MVHHRNPTLCSVGNYVKGFPYIRMHISVRDLFCQDGHNPLHIEINERLKQQLRFC